MPKNKFFEVISDKNGKILDMIPIDNPGDVDGKVKDSDSGFVNGSGKHNLETSGKKRPGSRR